MRGRNILRTSLSLEKTTRTPTSEVLPENVSNDNYAKYLTILDNRIRDTQETARNNLKRAKLRSKRHYDRKLKSCYFQVGDKVYLLKQPTHKLGDQ